MTATSRWTLRLAVTATTTALCLSILAGWQRGGTLPERVEWVAIGMVLVASAHLLPTLIRGAPMPVRAVGSLLWVACLATACYGHVVFFVFAQQHAGERRASAVTTVGVAPSGRGLTVVMTERASVTRQLAFARMQRCVRDCPVLEARRMTLSAKLDALNAEADDIRRRQAADDQVTAQRNALLADPITSRLATVLGTTTARVDLLSGLAFAGVLEGVACQLWTLALRSSSESAPVLIVAQPAVTAVTASHAPDIASRETVTGNHEVPSDPVTPLPATHDVVTQLARDVAAGRLRPTVAGIRRHLGCSQARAVTLRRQLAERNVTA